MTETDCSPDMCPHKDDILSLIKELRNTVSGVELMHTLLVNISAHVAPNIRSINNDLNSDDLTDTVSDIQLIYSLITNLTQHMGGKLELFNRKIEAFEEKIRRSRKCDTKLTDVTSEQSTHDIVNVNCGAASSVIEDPSTVENFPSYEVWLRYLANDKKSEETTSERLESRKFWDDCTQKMARFANMWDSIIKHGIERNVNVVLSSTVASTSKETSLEVASPGDVVILSEDSLDKNAPSSTERTTSSSESKMSRSKSKSSSLRKANEKKRNVALPIAMVGPRIAAASTCNGREPSLSYASAVGTTGTVTEATSEVNVEGQARRNGMLMTRTDRRRGDRHLSHITSPQGRDIQSLYPPTSPTLLEFNNNRNP